MSQMIGTVVQLQVLLLEVLLELGILTQRPTMFHCAGTPGFDLLGASELPLRERCAFCAPKGAAGIRRRPS